MEKICIAFWFCKTKVRGKIKYPQGKIDNTNADGDGDVIERFKIHSRKAILLIRNGFFLWLLPTQSSYVVACYLIWEDSRKMGIFELSSFFILAEPNRIAPIVYLELSKDTALLLARYNSNKIEAKQDTRQFATRKFQFQVKILSIECNNDIIFMF